MTLRRLTSGAVIARLELEDVLELAVDPVADPEPALVGVDMDVGGPRLAGAFEDLGDQVGEGRRGGQLLQLVADVELVLGPVEREGSPWPGPGCGRAPRPERAEPDVILGQRASAARRPGRRSGPGEIRLSSRIAWRRSTLVSPA